MMVWGKSRNCISIGRDFSWLVLELFVSFSLPNQHLVPTLVESWSPNIFPFSVSRYPAVFGVDHTERSKSKRQLHPFATRQPKIATVTSAINYDKSENGNEDETQFIEVESLSASQVTELVELSFFQACFALSKGDVEPLKLFIIAVKTASKKFSGASAIALAQTVDALPPSLRPLESQERELREIWIRAVYLMMAHVLDDFDGSDNIDDEVGKIYGKILGDLVAIHRTGMELNVNQFVASRKDVLMPTRNVLVLEDGPEDDDLVQLAVVTQTINVLYTTLVVLEEEDSNDTGVDGKIECASKSPSASSRQKKKRTRKSGKGFG